jgi:hypothetical protein
VRGSVVVQTVDEGRAAARAGVRAADVLERVGDQTLAGGTLEDFEIAVLALRDCAARGLVPLVLRRGLFLPPPTRPRAEAPSRDHSPVGGAA